MSTPDPNNQLLNGCPECEGLIDVSEVRPFEKIICPHCNAAIRVRTSFNHFTILKEIGEGGMSRVFRAQDNTLGREVALKILHSHFGERPDLLAQFEREARITASITHPNVVQVYTVGRDQGYFYIAMELLEGQSLDRVIIEQGAMNELAAVRMTQEVAQGLAAAHQSGLIHRDIKPGNILVDHHGTAKLVDFGLALIQGDEEDESSELWATPFYVPPEKLRFRQEDFRSDIYSLGATLFHALAGQPPHNVETDSVEELIAVKSRPVDLKALAPHLSDAVVDLVHRMMARQPEQRFDSYEQLLGRIASVRAEIDPEFTVGSNRKLGLVVKLAGGLVGLAFVAGIALVALNLTKEDEAEFGEDAGVSFGETEVVVSTADLSFQKDTEKAWNLLREGKLGEAYAIFRAISEQERARADVKAWSTFHLGVIGLVSGELDEARNELQRLEQMLDPRLSEEDRAFLQQCIEAVRSAGPLAPTAVEGLDRPGLASLVFGLKNWNLGSYQPCSVLLEQFASAPSPEGGEDDWKGAYLGGIESLRHDAALAARAPMPEKDSALGREEVEASLATLGEMQAEAKTDQVKAILEKRGRGFAKRLAVLDEEERKMRVAQEQEAVLGARASLGELVVNREFEKGTKLLAELETSDEALQRQIQHLVDIWAKTQAFYTDFLTNEQVMAYEGKIYQTDPDKMPFNAKVAAVNDDFIWVDLGFGPTKMSLDGVSNLGIMTIAQNTFLFEAQEDVKEGAAFFSLFTGQEELARSLAEGLRGIPGFSARWNALTTGSES